MGKLGISKVSHGITNLIPTTRAERERERERTSQVCFSRKGLCRLRSSGLVLRSGRTGTQSGGWKRMRWIRAKTRKECTPRVGLVGRCGLEQIQVGGKCMERGRKRLRGGGCGRERIMGLNGKMEERVGGGGAVPCLGGKWGRMQIWSELISWIWSTWPGG